MQQKTPVPRLLVRHAKNREIAPLHADSYSLIASLPLPANAAAPPLPPATAHSLRPADAESAAPGNIVCHKVGEKSVTDSDAETGGLHDVFRGKSDLSKSCYLVLVAIAQGGIRSARQLDESGVKLKTAERAITRLKAEGLIEKRDGYYQRTSLTLDAVAERLGTAGRAKRQRKLHAWERARFRDAVENDPENWWLSKKKLFVVDSFIGAPDPNWNEAQYARERPVKHSATAPSDFLAGLEESAAPTSDFLAGLEEVPLKRAASFRKKSRKEHDHEHDYQLHGKTTRQTARASPRPARKKEPALVPRHCAFCANAFSGRPGQRFCSLLCGQKARAVHRRARAANGATKTGQPSVVAVP